VIRVIKAIQELAVVVFKVHKALKGTKGIKEQSAPKGLKVIRETKAIRVR